jgi:hypothetical protein
MNIINETASCTKATKSAAYAFSSRRDKLELLSGCCVSQKQKKSTACGQVGFLIPTRTQQAARHFGSGAETRRWRGREDDRRSGRAGWKFST